MKSNGWRWSGRQHERCARRTCDQKAKPHAGARGAERQRTTHRKRGRSLNPRLWLAAAVYCAMLMLLSALAYFQPTETHIAVDQDPVRYAFQIMFFGLMMIVCVARWRRRKKVVVAPANVAGLERLWSR